MRRRTERGYILLASLWLVMLLALAGALIVRSAHTGAMVARNVGSQAQARALADGAIEWAVFQLLTDSGNTLAFGLPLTAPLSGGSADVRVTVMPEAAKVDLNNAPDELIEALLRVVGLPAGDARRLVMQLQDWRDQDDTPRPMGAEQDAYAAQAKPGPANRALLDWREIGLLLDAPADLTDRLKGLATVHGGPGIDLDFAPTPVRRAVDALAQPEAMDARAHGIYLVEAMVESKAGGRVARRAVIRLMPGHSPPYRLLALN